MIPLNSDLSTAARIRLIENALRDCGQDVTFEAVAAQFKRETGKTLPPPEQEIPWEK